MTPRGLVRLALLGEGGLAGVALVWSTLRDLPLPFGDPVVGVLAGAGAAGAMAAVNGYLLCAAPPVPPVPGLRRVYTDVLRPVFRGLGPAGIVAISVAAGLGEELLFRGVLQPEIGLVGASAAFGLAHLGGRGALGVGVLAAVMGAVLGGTAGWVGVTVQPVVAYAVEYTSVIGTVRGCRYTHTVTHDCGRQCPAVAPS